MFTGIVDHCGKVMSVVMGQGQGQGQSSRLFIGTEFSELVIGESIAVDGACLTVTELGSGGFWCDVSSETIDCTVAGEYRAGTRVNLERSLRISDRLGGHWVTGHVDQRGTVVRTEAIGEFVLLAIGGIDPSYSRYLLKKGSIAVNGVSLTVNHVTDRSFEVMVIPHTLQCTSLSQLAAGTKVNLEFDWMVKVILSDRDRCAGLLSPKN